MTWVGEKAFRASAAMKERIEAIGFLLKVYRSYDKCCRALDKKAGISSMNAFLLSSMETEPMLQYLCNRGASNLRVVIDAEACSQAEVQHFITGIVHPRDSAVSIAYSWEEVLGALGAVNVEASYSAPSVREVKREEPTPEVVASSKPVPVAEPGKPAATDAPWTLVWISDQAFKPAATSLKAQLEGLGCQVKGYKTHKNAARALDKKRALARTVVLVTGAEATQFLQYLSSRPEIAATRVVVEASARSSPVRESATCQVVEGFDAAVAAVSAIAADPDFV